MVPTTSTATWHDEKPPTEPPLKLIVEPPAVRRQRRPTPHELVALGGEASTTPAGRVSVKARSVTGVEESRLSIVKVSRLTLPTPIVSGANALLKLGCAEGGQSRDTQSEGGEQEYDQGKDSDGVTAWNLRERLG